MYQYVTEDIGEIEDVKFDLVADSSPGSSSFESHGETAERRQVSEKRERHVSYLRRREG